jgi:hypothetical protein
MLYYTKYNSLIWRLLLQSISGYATYVMQTFLLAPAHLESQQPSGSQSPSLTEDFRIDCIASGSNINTFWLRNQVSFQGDHLWAIDTSTYRSRGLKYGQTEGKKTSLTLNTMSALICSDVDRVNGAYRCGVNGTGAGIQSTMFSTSTLVSLRCK